jgi:hypothetical protein
VLTCRARWDTRWHLIFLHGMFLPDILTWLQILWWYRGVAVDQLTNWWITRWCLRILH